MFSLIYVVEFSNMSYSLTLIILRVIFSLFSIVRTNLTNQRVGILLAVRKIHNMRYLVLTMFSCVESFWMDMMLKKVNTTWMNNLDIRVEVSTVFPVMKWAFFSWCIWCREYHFVSLDMFFGIPLTILCLNIASITPLLGCTMRRYIVPIPLVVFWQSYLCVCVTRTSGCILWLNY